MNVSELFPSRYFKAADLQRALTLTIKALSFQTFSGERHPVLTFVEDRRALVLRPTTARQVAGLLGEETSAWTGRKIMLYPDHNIQFQARTVTGIRIRAATQREKPRAPEPPDDYGDSEPYADEAA